MRLLNTSVIVSHLCSDLGCFSNRGDCPCTWASHPIFVFPSEVPPAFLILYFNMWWSVRFTTSNIYIIYVTYLSETNNMSCQQLVFFFNDTATTEIYTLSLHDALPISLCTMLLQLVKRTNTGSTTRWNYLLDKLLPRKCWATTGYSVLRPECQLMRPYLESFHLKRYSWFHWCV